MVEDYDPGPSGALISEPSVKGSTFEVIRSLHSTPSYLRSLPLAQPARSTEGQPPKNLTFRSSVPRSLGLLKPWPSGVLLPKAFTSWFHAS